MSLGIGTGMNDVDCSFPDDVEEYEEKFNGVKFSLLAEEVILSYDTFYYYLNRACQIYLNAYPDERREVELYANAIKDKYSLR